MTPDNQLIEQDSAANDAFTPTTEQHISAMPIPADRWRISAEKVEQPDTNARLIQASKLATLGEMAAGVAHELNQPLNVIQMAAGNCLIRMSKGAADAEYLREKLNRVVEQTRRAAAIIDHMRLYGRSAHEPHHEVNLGDAINAAMELMGTQLRQAGISVSTKVDSLCPTVLGHEVKLEQVMVNLITNARDALVGNGSADKAIDIVAEADDLGDATVSVCDTGGGIPESVLPYIFEPFFTTKEMGAGTGLGLSVSYGIVRDMNGTILAANTTEGARLTLIMPRYVSGASLGRTI